MRLCKIKCRRINYLHHVENILVKSLIVKDFNIENIKVFKIASKILK